MKDQDTIYILATGAKDAKRLEILNQAYGPASESVLRRAGLGEGLRVAEIGCGTGNMTRWIAQQVGPRGAVAGVDRSLPQIEHARRQAAKLGLGNITFLKGTAYSPSLQPVSFDIAYCRLVLMHLRSPVKAVRAMGSLLRPGGRLVCEELDLTHWHCDPPARCVEQFINLNLKLGDRRGEDFRRGGSLHRLLREAGFGSVEVAAHLPLVLKGSPKQLLWMTFAEFAPALVTEGIATTEDIRRISQELREVADDETTLLGLPMMVQAWATK